MFAQYAVGFTTPQKVILIMASNPEQHLKISQTIGPAQSVA